MAWWIIFIHSMKLDLLEHPLRCCMDLVDLGARSTFFFVDLEFTELEHLAEKIRNRVVF